MSKLPVIVHADIVEQSALEQIELAASQPAFRERIVIMPDVHAGAGCVIGFTGKFAGSVIPNIVGVDVGCGVATHPLSVPIDIVKSLFQDFDKHIRNTIPLGFNHHVMRNGRWVFYDAVLGMDARLSSAKSLYDDVVKRYSLKTSPMESQIGTLGGGNHFIELDASVDGQVYATVHTGSRNFGLQVAGHFQSKAKKIAEELGLTIPKGLEALPMSAGGEDYMAAMRVAQTFASLNREVIMREILSFFDMNYLAHGSSMVKFDANQYIDTAHNFISPRDNIIRKGAVEAYSDQRIVIPFNMSDGIIIGKGKSNKDYNFSAPHGSGRTHGRKEMNRMLADGRLSMQSFKDSMQGIYSTSIGENTIDESKFAYKPTDVVMKHLIETVDIEQRLMPIYNLKDDSKVKE